MPYVDKEMDRLVKSRYHLSPRGRAATKKYNDSPKGRRTRHGAHLKRTYGITIEEYDARVVAQGGHCCLCLVKPENNWGGKLHVDHDKATGTVRGLLCKNCNTALGKLGDNEAGLLRALEYIRGKH